MSQQRKRKFSKELEDIKMKQLEIFKLKSIITKVKSSVDELKSRMKGTKETTSKLEDKQ